MLNSDMERFELALWMGEGTERMGSIESSSVGYNADLFDAATIARLVGHLQNLLHAIIVDPNRRISELPLLTAAERAKF